MRHPQLFGHLSAGVALRGKHCNLSLTWSEVRGGKPLGKRRAARHATALTLQQPALRLGGGRSEARRGDCAFGRKVGKGEPIKPRHTGTKVGGARRGRSVHMSQSCVVQITLQPVDGKAADER